MDEERFSAVANTYRTMYLSAKNDKERKEKINAFRAGYIRLSTEQNDKHINK